jgi:hypothetical protein
MKKIIALMLSLLLCLGMLIACGPDDGDGSSSSSSESSSSELPGDLPSDKTDVDNIVDFTSSAN